MNTPSEFRIASIAPNHALILPNDERVIDASLEISPEPRSLRFVQDAFGNHVGIARFSGRSKELCFESIVCLEHSPLDAADLDLEDAARTFPVDYSADEMPDLAHCIERPFRKSYPDVLMMQSCVYRKSDSTILVMKAAKDGS